MVCLRIKGNEMQSNNNNKQIFDLRVTECINTSVNVLWFFVNEFYSDINWFCKYFLA